MLQALNKLRKTILIKTQTNLEIYLKTYILIQRILIIKRGIILSMRKSTQQMLGCNAKSLPLLEQIQKHLFNEI